jgi:hypothetical protein
MSVITNVERIADNVLGGEVFGVWTCIIIEAGAMKKRLTCKRRRSVDTVKITSSQDFEVGLAALLCGSEQLGTLLLSQFGYWSSHAPASPQGVAKPCQQTQS